MRWMLLAVALVGCNKAPPETTAQKQGIHPDLQCPEGTLEAGRAPPDGYDAWCQAIRASGRWIRHGPNLTWHPNGQRASFGEYVDGRQSGLWTFYYPTGQIERKGNFVGGVAEGAWTTFHPSGERRSEGEMVGGKEHGEWTYWEQDGKWTRGTWVLGQRDGTWTDHAPDDVAYRERTYKSGRMVGMREL